jgi:hypothetical protein
LTPGHPGLDVSEEGRGCNNVFGSFVIKTISADTLGTVNRLDATFTQHCESPDAPPMTGVVKYRAPTSAPITITSSNPSLSQLQPTTFTAVVSSTTSGFVTFLDGTASIGTAPVDANSLASLSTSSLAVGNHQVTASYGGGTSAPILQTIRSIVPYHNGVALPARTFASTATAEIVTGLARGTTYTFEVAARNARGTGPRSATTNKITTS